MQGLRSIMTISRIARNEVRRNRYKRFRRMKSEEKLLNKRHQLSSSQFKLENLPCMVAGLNSKDNNMQLEATTQLRKLLCREPKPVDEVVQSGVVPRLVEFLTKEDSPQLQFEAASALINITAGTSKNIKVVIDHGAVSIFVKLLDSSPRDDMREQAVSALGNIAAHSDKFRDLVLGQGALIPLLFQLNEGANLSMLRKATWTLSQFCRDKPPSEFQQIKPALPALECLLFRSKDEEVLTNACWALVSLSNGPMKQTQAVMDAGICKRLVELLYCHPSPSVLIPALLTIAEIMRCDDIQLQAVFETGVIPPIVKLLQTAEDDRVIEEAAKAIACAGFWRSNKHIFKYLVNQGCINPLCDLLECSNRVILMFSLQALGDILEAGEAEKNAGGEVNIYKDLIQDASEGLERIKYLRGADNDLIVEMAVKILETYYLEEFQKCVKLKPVRFCLT